MELDFLGLRAAAAADEHHNKNSSSASSSIRGMETRAIARIDPQLLRRVIARPPPPPAAAEETTAPMTLFYNGSVAIFDVSHDKAKAIMRMATEVTTTEGRVNGNTLVGNFAKDMPLARTKSLHRFLQKRKERLTRLCPYQLGGPATTGKSFHVKKEAEAA